MEKNPFGGKQPERLLEYLKTHKTITALQGWDLLGIYRMSDSIFKLRRRGYLIETRIVTVTNRWGEGCEVAEYIYTPTDEALKVCADEVAFQNKN